MFLKGIAMENYEKVLAENGIDCLEVLRGMFWVSF